MATEMPKVALERLPQLGRIFLERATEVSVDGCPGREHVVQAECWRVTHRRELSLAAHGFGSKPVGTPGHGARAEPTQVQLLREQQVADVFEHGPLAARRSYGHHRWRDDRQGASQRRLLVLNLSQECRSVLSR